jgi:hypothetical protein
MTQIDAALKDKVLRFLKTHADPELPCRMTTETMLLMLETDSKSLQAILIYFDRQGFIHSLVYHHLITKFHFTINGLTFINYGGFVAQEIKFRAEVEKLLIEVETLRASLEPNQLETANKMSAIASAVFSAFQLILPTL